MAEQRCAYCEEAILPTELAVPVLVSGKPAHFHRECQLRAVVGSVSHQKGTCCCYGGTENDPPGMTVRQAARAAAEYFDRGGRHAGWPPHQSLN